jgi:hypothetical protein
MLRHQIVRALGLLRQRPPDRSEQRTRLHALREHLTRLADQPPSLPAAIAGKADQLAGTKWRYTAKPMRGAVCPWR